MSLKLFDVSSKVALVTGGSKGLGKSMARALALAGADVVISSRHQDSLYFHGLHVTRRYFRLFTL